jgi:hypothetical protein
MRDRNAAQSNEESECLLVRIVQVHSAQLENSRVHGLPFQAFFSPNRAILNAVDNAAKP